MFRAVSALEYQINNTKYKNILNINWYDVLQWFIWGTSSCSAHKPQARIGTTEPESIPEAHHSMSTRIRLIPVISYSGPNVVFWSNAVCITSVRLTDVLCITVLKLDENDAYLNVAQSEQSRCHRAQGARRLAPEEPHASSSVFIRNRIKYFILVL